MLNTYRGRNRHGLLVVIVGLLVLFLLANGGGVWAAGGPLPRRGTVPTPTPRVSPTQPKGQPAPPPKPTRIVPPTRTPCLDCPTPTPVPVDAPVHIMVNVGGDVYTDTRGLVWEADREYAEGLSPWGFVLGDAEAGTFVGSLPIAGTADLALYQNERWAMAAYVFEVPNGDYQVTLKFAEQYRKAAGERIFTVALQGQTVLKDFDIAAQAGGVRMALDRVFTAVVTRSILTIEFLPQVENPVVAAIAVRRILAPTPTAQPTATPTPTETPEPTEAPTISPTSTPTRTLTPSPTATPLPSTARQVALLPQAAAILRSESGAVLVHAPAGVAGQPLMLFHIPEDGDSAPPLSIGFRMGSQIFSLHMSNSAGVFIPNALLPAALTVTVRYNAQDLAAAQGFPHRLALLSYRPDAKQWLALETSVDEAAGTVSARVRRLGLFALGIHMGPAVASWREEQTDSRLPALGAGLAGVVIGVIAGRWMWRRRPSPRAPDTRGTT